MGNPLPQPAAPAAPPPLGAPAAGASAWGALPEPLLLLALGHLAETEDPAALAAAHRVCRSWRHAAQLATRSLRFAGAPPDTERLRLCFPNVAALSLERMQLAPKELAHVAGLTRLTALHLRWALPGHAAAVAHRP